MMKRRAGINGDANAGMNAARFLDAVCEEAESHGVDCGGARDVEDVVAALELVSERVQALREEQRRRDEVAARVIVLHWPMEHPIKGVLWGGLAQSVDGYFNTVWWPTANDFSRIRHSVRTKLISVAMDWPESEGDGETRVLRFDNEFDDEGVKPRPGEYAVVDVFRKFVRACQTLEDAVYMADVASRDLSSDPAVNKSLCVVVRKTAEGAYEEAHRTAYDGEVFARAYENGARVFCAHPNEGWTRCDADDAAAYALSCAPNFAELFV